MINKEFIEKIEDMTGPKVIETDHGAFSDKQLHRIEDRLIDTTKLSSLSGLVTMMKWTIMISHYSSEWYHRSRLMYWVRSDMICNVKDHMLHMQNSIALTSTVI